MPMKKKIIINTLIYFIIFCVGCCVGELIDWGYFILSKEISIIDALSLFLSLGCAIYIAKVLEKDIQDDRIEKDMFIAQVENIETTLIELLNKLNGSTYNEITSLYSKSNIKRHKLFKKIDSFKKSVFKVDDIKKSLDLKFKQLKPLLTYTAVVPETTPDVEIKRGKITYSSQRIVQINDSIECIQDELFKLKIIMNKA